MRRAILWAIRKVSGAAAAVIAGGIAFLIPPVWVSTAVLHIAPPSDPAPLIHAALTDAALERIASGLPHLRDAMQRRPAAEVIAEMRRNIRVAPLKTGMGAQAFAASFQCRDRETAPAVVSNIVALLVETNLTGRFQRNLQVLDPASLPDQPLTPNRVVLMLLGLGAGLLAGSLATVVRRPRALGA